jgi:DNA-binding transcriptional MerR regulator
MTTKEGPAVPTAEKPKTAKPTWLDWHPEGAPLPPLLSHEELLEELHEQGIDISPYTLEHWRRTGILPRPVRRAHEGAVRPVYPAWFVPAITHIKQQQRDGKGLDEIRDAIGPLLTMWALNALLWRDPDLDAATAALDMALREYARASQGWLRDKGVIKSIRVTLIDGDGNELDHHDAGYGSG